MARRSVFLYGALLWWVVAGVAEAQIRLTVGYVTIASGSGALWVAKKLAYLRKTV